MTSALIATLAAATALAAPEVRQPRDPSTERYQAIVATYRGGERAEAVQQLLQMNRGDVERVVRRIVAVPDRRAGRAVDPVFVRAAALLHAEAAFWTWRHGPVGQGDPQFDIARRLADATDTAGEPPGPFRRRWYLATALMISTVLVADDAIAHFDRAVKALPDDATLLTAAGWFAERAATREAGELVGPGEHRRLTTGFLRSAEDYLTRALAVQPGDTTAMLRLARVAILAGDDARARTRLAGLVETRELDPAIGYVAQLLLGSIRERAGERAAAESSYREAIALNARAQSARLALGQLLYAHGDAAGAAGTVDAFLESPSADNDPWSSYLLAYLPLGRSMFEELLAEVKP